ncbi:TIGR02710 family CRISPR-associated CARF protein [uncultured Methanobrevibacter sp.]|uniref:TIGR02710 family CRISPR-associated CARF protein n=1 Tax=uncultured Methanobrevibacter sp. TaxID=253161 RepID=UPI0025FFC83E|nr:TIGR02710 family CRISPR-associated CARF protein [uncultured Methanobrevibacter sp.]
MGRDKTALFMTVGIGGQNKESLVNGLYTCIDKTNTDLIVFFASEQSIEGMIPFIKKAYLKDKQRELTHSKTIKLENVDDFDHIFNKIKNEVLTYQDEYKIIINYNSGTKTMTMTAALISALYNTDLISVIGKRNNKGFIESKTEQINYLNLYQYYDELLINKLREYFNNNNFESGKLLFKDITSNKINKDAYEKLFNAYYAADNVNFEETFENFDSKLFKEECEGLDNNQLDNNSKAFNIINIKNKDGSYHSERDYYILASILNNARRKYDDNKYDDGIARLYRSLELIAQIRLNKKYGIDAGNVDIALLEDYSVDEKFIKKIKNKKEKNISLNDDYILLKLLDDELGIYYEKNYNKIRNMLTFRNNSILAHGLDSLSKEQFKKFNNEVLNIARLLKPDIDDLIKYTKFPTFKLD